ncbi:hypothetical protein B296_00007475 [Ensete ventricosum]|uniref:Dynein light chain n=1 Tax=Ensete ventricosum TaxID=4639 RepID=A0A426ZXM3_ENSVE|nr:hypothetical protein B296_00007475 [Ensete ventricosum]
MWVPGGTRVPPPRTVPCSTAPIDVDRNTRAAWKRTSLDAVISAAGILLAISGGYGLCFDEVPFPPTPSRVQQHKQRADTELETVGAVAELKGKVNPKPEANRKGQRWRRRTGPRKCQIFHQTPVGDITPHTRAEPVLFDRFRFLLLLLLLLLVFSWNASWWPPHKAMRGAAKKASVEGASEELERRSQYLSSLIQRTKVKSEADQDTKEVVEAAAKSERRELHDHSQHRHHHQEPRQRKQEEDVEDKQEDEEKKGIKDGDGVDGGPPQEQRQPPNVKVRAADMPLALQKRAFRCARETLASMPKLQSKRLACALKKARFFPLYLLFNQLT